MSDTSKTKALVDLANLATSQGAPPSSAQEQMARLLVVKMEKELEAEKEEAERARNFRLSQLQSIKDSMRIQEDTQAACPHMKPNFRPAIGGQRDGKGHYQWLCQYCGKQWIDAELPVALRIPQEMVGGPQ